MLKNLLFALAVGVSFSATAFPTKHLPADTISVRATVDKRDVIVVHGDKLWISHVKGELPSNIWINHVPWVPTWTDERETDTFTMSEPPRRLPMTSSRGLISVSVAQEDAVASIIEYPHEFNEWILMVALYNVATTGPLEIDVTISWKKDVAPTELGCVPVLPTIPSTMPSPTPVGLR